MLKSNLKPFPEDAGSMAAKELLEVSAKLAEGKLSALILCATDTEGHCDSMLMGSPQLIELMLGIAVERVLGNVQEDGTVPKGTEN